MTQRPILSLERIKKALKTFNTEQLKGVRMAVDAELARKGAIILANASQNVGVGNPANDIEHDAYNRGWVAHEKAVAEKSRWETANKAFNNVQEQVKMLTLLNAVIPDKRAIIPILREMGLRQALISTAYDWERVARNVFSDRPDRPQYGNSLALFTASVDAQIEIIDQALAGTATLDRLQPLLDSDLVSRIRKAINESINMGGRPEGVSSWRWTLGKHWQDMEAANPDYEPYRIRLRLLEKWGQIKDGEHIPREGLSSDEIEAFEQLRKAKRDARNVSKYRYKLFSDLGML